MKEWKDLDIRTKANYIRTAVSQGLKSLKDIEDSYQEFNKFDEGGYNPNIDDIEQPGYREYMLKLANRIASERGGNVQKIYQSLLSNDDNTFNYRRWYNTASQEDLDKALQFGYGHWSDKAGKTVNHPTFSTDSPYSGTINPYNPLGIVGGKWTEHPDELQRWEYKLSPSQLQNNWDLDKTINYVQDAEDDGITIVSPSGQYPIINGDLFGGVLPSVNVLPANKHSNGGNLFYNGGENDVWELGALNRANNVSTNYEDAKDNTLSNWNLGIRKAAKWLQDNVSDSIPAGISNCTLTATQWVDPNNPIMSAKTIYENPEQSNYTSIKPEDAVPGNLLIARNPNNGSFHTMMIQGFADKNGTYEFNGKKYKYKKGEPLLRYSNGSHNIEGLRKGIPLSVYTKNSDGHTENNYYRYNYPNQVFLPEITITPKRHSKGGNLFSGEDTDTQQMNPYYIKTNDGSYNVFPNALNSTNLFVTIPQTDVTPELSRQNELREATETYLKLHPESGLHLNNINSEVGQDNRNWFQKNILQPAQNYGSEFGYRLAKPEEGVLGPEYIYPMAAAASAGSFGLNAALDAPGAIAYNWTLKNPITASTIGAGLEAPMYSELIQRRLIDGDNSGGLFQDVMDATVGLGTLSRIPTIASNVAQDLTRGWNWTNRNYVQPYNLYKEIDKTSPLLEISPKTINLENGIIGNNGNTKYHRTWLGMYERPSKITIAEKSGLPKHDRHKFHTEEENEAFIQKANEFAEKYDYPKINSEGDIERQARDMLDRHNTFLRGVNPKPFSDEDIAQAARDLGENYTPDQYMQYAATHGRDVEPKVYVGKENALTYGSSGKTAYVQYPYRLGRNRMNWFEEADLPVYSNEFIDIDPQEALNINGAISPWQSITNHVPTNELMLTTHKPLRFKGFVSNEDNVKDFISKKWTPSDYYVPKEYEEVDASKWSEIYDQLSRLDPDTYKWGVPNDFSITNKATGQIYINPKYMQQFRATQEQHTNILLNNSNDVVNSSLKGIDGNVKLATDFNINDDTRSIYNSFNWKQYLNSYGQMKPNPQQQLKDINTYTDTYNKYAKEIDNDLRFKFFEPGNLYDLDKLEDWEVKLYYGPEAAKLKQSYDIAQQKGNTEVANKLRDRIQSMFAIDKEDADVAAGLQQARDIYDIPEYRERFNKFGTLGDTFIYDALNRLDNVQIQGKHNITGQEGLNGGAGAFLHSPNQGTIWLDNYSKSSRIQDFIRHEGNHIAHGLQYQPGFMKMHNEKIRPIPKEKATTAAGRYQEDMDEIVERAKTAVEYADKHRLEGESLDDALDRIADEIAEGDNIYNEKYPSDMRQAINHFTLDSIKKFWKGFVGGILPTGIFTGIGLSTPSNKQSLGGNINRYNQDSNLLYIKPKQNYNLLF